MTYFFRLAIFVFVFHCGYGVFSQNGGLTEQQRADVEIFNKILSTPNTIDSVAARAYLDLAGTYYYSNPDTVAPLSRQALELCKKNLKPIPVNKPYYALASEANFNIGIMYSIGGDNKNAREYFDESYSFSEKIFDYTGMMNALNSIAVAYSNESNLPKALEIFYNILDLAERTKDSSRIALSLNNIGYALDMQNDDSLALTYYIQSLDIRKKVKERDAYEIGGSLNNVGAMYLEMGEYAKAKAYFLESIPYREELGDQFGLGYTFINLAIVYHKQDSLDKAEELYFKSIELRERMNDVQGLITSYRSLAQLYFDRKNVSAAYLYADKAWKLVSTSNYTVEKRDAAALISQIYASKGNWFKAYQVLEEFIKMDEVIENEANKTAILSERMQYDYEKQHLADSLAFVQNEKVIEVVHKAELEKEANQRYVLYAGIFILMIFGIFVFRGYQQKKKDHRIIQLQKSEVEHQKEIIEETHREITDSIAYAKRLQDAILPSADEVDSHLPDNFILFKPKDVVSGDFYWFEHVQNTSYIAVADCTGHGVPGAMVSVVCSNALHRSLNEFGLKEPAEILDKTRDLIIETFAKSGTSVKDGMDISLCSLVFASAQTDACSLQYAGANNPLWIVRKKKYLTQEQIDNKNTLLHGEVALIEIKGSKQPCGLYDGMKPFERSDMQLVSGDILYLFTDGLPDQFGGEKGKKFKYQPFKKLVLEASNQEMENQKNIIEAHFDNWKGNLEQIDDVCVVGVRV